MPRRAAGENFRRSRARRLPKRRLLVICEGRSTEPTYFRALRTAFRNSLLEVEIEKGGATPKTLVERAAARKRQAVREAKRERDGFLAYDEVWCVFDVDEHPYLPDANQQARDHGIELAVSNPCFELWALLHFQEQSAFLERGTARSRLRRHLPGYEKALPFDCLRPYYVRAVARAANLDRRCATAGRPGDNPSTGVYRLTERIRQEGRSAPTA
jgi:hypothetical protein